VHEKGTAGKDNASEHQNSQDCVRHRRYLPPCQKSATIGYGQSLSHRLKRRQAILSRQPIGHNVRLAIASDHAAFALKAELTGWLRGLGHDVADLGPDSTDSVDYPDYGFALAAHIAAAKADFGIALCGSGIGISIAVNRHPACRAALVSEPLSARLSREHNDANVIALGARLTGSDMARACIETFLATPFAGDRHVRRVGKLTHPPALETPA
jgi:ribose 5-phosphate isomerase B